MDTQFIIPFVDVLQGYSPEALSLLLLFFSLSAIIFLYMRFQVAGLYVYNAIAIVAANVQVLKLTAFSWFSEPIALGTIIFATIYLSSEIITEFHGRQVAQKGVWLSFYAQLLMTVFMLFALGYKADPQDTSHHAMAVLFMPSMRLFVASLTSFAVSQLIDIWAFDKIRHTTGAAYLWLRTGVAFILSGCVDTLVFSYLAWSILAPKPLGWEQILTRYVVPTYASWVPVSLLAVLGMYVCRTLVKRKALLHAA